MTAEEFIEQWKEESPYIEAQTSGSTGKPKTIRLNKSDLILSARATNEFFGLKEGARFVCPMDFKYIGAKMMAIRSIVAKGELVAVEPSNDIMFEGDADLLAIVPSQADCLIKNKDLWPRVKNLIIGGAPLDKKREEELLKTGIKAYSTYGMTETGSHVALAPLGTEIYEGLPGIKFSADERGCLIIDMPERIQKRFVTNDIVEMDTENKFRWKGRYDNVINSSGIKISPEILDAKLSEVLSEMKIQFSSVLTLGVPSEKWGEAAVCVIETDDNIGPDTLNEIREKLKLKTGSRRYCPKTVITHAIAKTASGKPDRKTTREEIMALLQKKCVSL